ncbi:protein FAM47E isoform A [Alligator mississippiensis]|uniref:Protein FAM47E isoform A n=1 Tax=Alligator mississippiensis TaxID=8496 RepID=A0A151MMX7_ALLMI|nr:protein FAM47E isoform A [Alligator mississippiensis]
MGSAPWYKEKLPSKCFREYNNKLKFSDSLNSQHWRFLKSGLDDFRNGFPPPSDNIIIRGTKGPFPVILHKDTPQASSMAQQKARKPFNKHPCKLNLLQKYRRDYVAQAEHCSSQYPLVLYPHLKGSVSPKIFQEVVAVLDSKMCLSFEPGYRDHGQESHGLQKEKSPLKDGQRKETIPAPKSSAPSKESKDKNPYIWFSKKKTTAREKAARLQYVPPLEENVKQVTKEFCDWASSLGGDKHSIEEDTLTSLFDTGYETHPMISVPIQMVEINNVPPELKRCLGVSSSRTAVKSPLKVPVCKGLLGTREKWRGRQLEIGGATCMCTHIAMQSSGQPYSPSSCIQDSYQPKFEKIKYGAWYLNPKTWKKLKANEPLMDPKATIDNFQQLRKQFCEKEAEVMQLHGTHAFKEFLERKGYRKPEFLLQMLAVGSRTGAQERTSCHAKEIPRGKQRVFLHAH